MSHSLTATLVAGAIALGGSIATPSHSSLIAPGRQAVDSTALAVVVRAANAMGGRTTLEQLGVIRRTISGAISDPTQGPRPSAVGEKNPAAYGAEQRTATVDYRGGRQRAELIGTIYGGQPMHIIQALRPDSVMLANLSLGTATRRAPGGGPVPQPQFAEAIVRRAMAKPEALTLRPTRVENGKSYDVVAFVDGRPQPSELLFDNQTGLLHAVLGNVPDPVSGDVESRELFLDYRKQGAMLLPMVQETRFDGVLFRRNTVTRFEFDPQLPADYYTIQDGLAPAEAPLPGLTTTSVGKDLYLVRGSYNSLFAVFDDHVVILEAPVSSQRTNLMLAEIRKVAPDKPIRFVVASHFHSDHLGGLRPLIAAGVTILTTRSGREVISSRLVGGVRKLAPDTLVTAPRAPIIEVIEKSRVLSDANHRIELYQIGPNPHAEEILITWLPGEKLLFEGDMLDLLIPEGKPSMPGDDTRALAKTLASLKLDVQKIIPVHGRPGTREDLDRTLARGSQP